MIKNKKIQINLKEGVSSAQKFRLKSVNKKLKKSLFAMNCRACGADCHETCFAMLRQYRVNQIEIDGGKSDFLNAVDVNERDVGVPMELYQQLLAELIEIRQTSDICYESEDESAAEPIKITQNDKKADKNAGEKPAKTISDAPGDEKPNKSPTKKDKFPSIFESVDAVLPGLTDFDEKNNAPRPEFLKD